MCVCACNVHAWSLPTRASMHACMRVHVLARACCAGSLVNVEGPQPQRKLLRPERRNHSSMRDPGNAGPALAVDLTKSMLKLSGFGTKTCLERLVLRSKLIDLFLACLVDIEAACRQPATLGSIFLRFETHVCVCICMHACMYACLEFSPDIKCPATLQ